jgi:hypothetical protein
LAQGKKEAKSNLFSMLYSGCGTTPTCNGHHGFIRSLNGTFYYFIEILSSLLSEGSRLIHILLDLGAALFFCWDLFCVRCCVSLFWPSGPCIKLGAIGTCLRVGEWPQHPFGCCPIYLYVSRVTKNRFGFALM